METSTEHALSNLPLEPALLKEIRDYGRLKKVRAGQLVISPHSTTKEMPLVLNGILKVMKQDQDGHEIFLYYLEGGDTCAMSISCCIEGKLNRFKVEAEEDSQLWMIPMAHVDGWVQKYSSFRKYVFDAYQSRFNELLETIESIAFMNMDQRLLKFLLDKKQATGSYSIHMTHQQIARELNSSRVVVSRLLKQLERQQKIKQYRNRIEIL